jgi:hypothetical protein
MNLASLYLKSGARRSRFGRNSVTRQRCNFCTPLSAPLCNSCAALPGGPHVLRQLQRKKAFTLGVSFASTESDVESSRTSRRKD